MSKRKIEPKPILSERIKIARRVNLLKHKEKDKLTQEDLAELLEVSVQTIRKYESGKYGIPNRSVREIAHVLGCSVAYLNGDTECFTVEEYEAERREFEDTMAGAKIYLDEIANQYRITADFLKTFLGYRFQDTFKISQGSFEPLILLTDPDGHSFQFGSRLDFEDFMLNFYDDVKELLQYHLCKREFYNKQNH